MISITRLVLLSSMLVATRIQSTDHVHDWLMSQEITDPIFGLSYNPQTHVFENAPGIIFRQCKGFKDHKTLWVYAHWHGDSTDYYIVSGIRKLYPDGAGKPILDTDFGTAVAIRRERCDLQESSWMLSGYTSDPRNTKQTFQKMSGDVFPGLGAAETCDDIGNCHYVVRSLAEERVLRGIIRDALRRYAIAFGGKQQFLNAAQRKDIIARMESFPMLKEEFAKFSS